MNPILVTSEELQKALEITSYDVYQFLRRGLPSAQSNPMFYNLDEAREWINGFGAREEKREAIKKDLLSLLTAEESKIVTQPKWNAQYAVVWGTTNSRRALTIQRAIYLMVQYSTSRADNKVYLSETKKQSKEVQVTIDEHLGELAQGFKALTIHELAATTLKQEEGVFEKQADSVQLAVQLLEDHPALQEKYGLIYRQFFVEELERFNSEEVRLIQLLSNDYGEYMLNINQRALGQSKELNKWLQRLDEIYFL